MAVTRRAICSLSDASQPASSPHDQQKLEVLFDLVCTWGILTTVFSWNCELFMFLHVSLVWQSPLFCSIVGPTAVQALVQ